MKFLPPMETHLMLVYFALNLQNHVFSPFCRHAQSLAALQAYSHWLAQYCSEAHRQNTQQFVTLISTTMDAVTPLISTKVLKQRGLHLFSNSVCPSVHVPIYYKIKILHSIRPVTLTTVIQLCHFMFLFSCNPCKCNCNFIFSVL